MIFMLHKEARNIVVQALNYQIPVKEIATYFSVNTSTIYRLLKQLKATDSVETRTSLRGRKRSLSADDISRIDRPIQQQPDITIYEVTDTLHLHTSDKTFRKVIVKLGYVYKKMPTASQLPCPSILRGKGLFFALLCFIIVS